MNKDKNIEFLDLISEYIETEINHKKKRLNEIHTPEEAYTQITLDNHKKVLEEIKDILILNL